MTIQSQTLVDQLRSVRGATKSRDHASYVNRALVLLDAFVKILSVPNNDTAKLEQIKEKLKREGMLCGPTVENASSRSPGTFRVSWEVDLEGADSHREAAQQVASTYFKPYVAAGDLGSACIFQVTGADSIAVAVDLSTTETD